MYKGIIACILFDFHSLLFDIYQLEAVLLLWIICVINVFVVIVMLSRLFVAALWSPAGKWLTSWAMFVMSNCDFVTFPCGILDQV